MTLNLHVFAFSLKESATYLERKKHMIHMMLEKNICTIQSILQTGAASFKGNTMSFKQQVHFEENASLS